MKAASDAKTIDGVPVDLYLAWSLTDGVEWAEKMTKLFGIVWTDYAKGGERVPKDSAYWLAETFRTLNSTAPAAQKAPAAEPKAPAAEKPAAEPKAGAVGKPGPASI